MGGGTKGVWKKLEQWRAGAFLLGGLIFVVDAGLLGAHLAMGTDPPLELGQAFVGASWTAAFIGLLGVYPDLADRTRWLARIGAVFSVIGAVVMAAMSATSIGYYTGVLSGALGDVVMYFLPGVFLGIVLGFGLFGIASLRTDVYARSIGLLFLLLVATFLFNIGTSIAGFTSMAKVTGVVSVLALSMLSIGYLLRSGGALADPQRAEASGDSLA